MKLIIESTVERKVKLKQIELEGSDYYDCICKLIESPTNLGGFVETKAEEIAEGRSQMYSDEDIAREAFEETMRIYNINWQKKV